MSAHNLFFVDILTYEPCHEKTGFLHMQKNKGADQLRSNYAADQRLFSLHS